MAAFHLPDGYLENPMISVDGGEVGYWNQAKADSKGAIWQADVYRLVAAMVRPDYVVIDVGCGTGQKLRRFVAPLVQRAIGVDQASGVASARRLDPQGEWIEGDLGSEPVWDELAVHEPDIVICSDVIEHVTDPIRLLAHLRGLAATGRLVLSTPDRAVMYGPTHNGPPSNPRHVREWTAIELRALLEDNGLIVESEQHLMARDRWPLRTEAKRALWNALHLQRPGRKRSCMAFVCRPV
jgi:SAM-dependent methyltransferase